ncbi:MAG: hypothetical protein AABY16_03420 [Nanoarchaeota archaeon]
MLQKLKIYVKAQSAVEFIILVGFIAFFFLIFLFVIQANTADERWDNRNMLTQELALEIQQEISLAAGSSSGYSRQFTLPVKISGLAYTAEIVENTVVYVHTDNGEHALSLPVSYVNGNLVLGVNTIKNIGGAVYLNP